MSAYKKILVAIDPLCENDKIIKRAESFAGSSVEISLAHIHVPRIDLDVRYADPKREHKEEEKAS